MAQKSLKMTEQLIRPAMQERSKERTQRIIVAGLELLQDHNFEDLHVGKIAEKAGCSVGTLYKRFTNKEALLEVMAQTARQEIVKELDDGLADEVEKTTSLLELMETVIAFVATVLRKREMLLRALLYRQLAAPGAILPLQQSARDVGALALQKARQHKPKHLSDDEFERRFGIAFQMIISTFINMIVNRPGPLFLRSEGIEKDLSFAAVGYLQAKTKS